MVKTINAQQRDTSAWIMLVWLAFAGAVLLAGVGIWNLPIDDWQKGFMAMGMLFTLGSTFSLVKTTRDNRFRRVDTGAWIFQVWAAFVIALGMTAGGLWNLDVPGWVQGYAAIAQIFMMMMAFTLAKTVRDNNPTVIDGLNAENEVESSASAPGAGGPRLAGGIEPPGTGADAPLSREAVQAMVRAKNAEENKPR